MNTKELIKLARKADIEGDLELADFIDRQLLAISNNKNIREAAGFSDSLSKMSRGVGNFFGNIGNFLGGYGGYNGPTNTKPLRDALQSVPNRSGLGKMFGSVGKEIEFSPEQLTELGDGLKSSLFNSRSKATPEVQSVIDEIINSGKVSGAKVTKPDGSSLSGPPAMNYKLDLLRQHAIQNKIINPRSGARLDDLDAIASGKPLAAGPRTVQRVNKNTKLLAGAGAAAMAAPGLYGMFAGQGPDTTGSAVPDGSMGPAGMPQLGPMGGFGGGYNGPEVGRPGMGGYAPTQPIGLGYANSVMDPASNRESAGYAPTSQYTGRSEGEINPAAKFRSYEGMMRGERAPAFNNQSYVGGYSQPTVAPVITPQVNVQPVAAPAVVPEQLTSIPPVNTGAAPQALPANFADALRPATPEEAARYEQPPAAPMTPEQIGAAMNPLATSGY